MCSKLDRLANRIPHLGVELCMAERGGDLLLVARLRRSLAYARRKYLRLSGYMYSYTTLGVGAS